jgi:hypothetical protein
MAAFQSVAVLLLIAGKVVNLRWLRGLMVRRCIVDDCLLHPTRRNVP